MPESTNRLAKEKSPYLRQHAHNPVDWYPWGDEAFETAKREDKPVLLSIGYATCHWCHVMERESFENESIAQQMNDAFVCIKVDREERPDIDNVYMTVCQMMTGQGGWPLTIIMTPEMKPFHAATYIPPDSRFGRLGMRELIPRLVKVWMERRDDVFESASRITQALSMQHKQASGTRLNAKVLDAGYNDLMKQYDRQHGGFGAAPRFPTPHRLVFLLRYGRKEGIQAVEHTLREMRKGGMYDHVGFGFHRYSTDREWLVPHFEKMLYDQALLALAYTEAHALTRDPFYRRVAEEILTYVERDMTAPEGGFYSAEDADSEGEEGLFYVWEAAELQTLLGTDYTAAAECWNIREEGNYRDEASGRLTGRNIPHLKCIPSPAELAELEPIRKTLFDVREQRIHPLKDTKILTDWNGLMIAAMARAGRVFGETRWRDAAVRAFRFIETCMCREDGTLWHRFCDGHTAVPGQLEDYVFLISGLLELYDTTLDVQYLKRAVAVNETVSVSFTDPDGGGYFMTSHQDGELIVRPRNIYDGALPSGNSMHMENLLRMARLTGRFELEQQAADAGRAFGGLIHHSPSAFAQVHSAILFGAGKGVEIVVTGKRDDAAVQRILEYIQGVYDPGRSLVFKEVSTPQIGDVCPFVKSMDMVDGKPAIYLCRNFTCEMPITSLEDLKTAYPARE